MIFFNIYFFRVLIVIGLLQNNSERVANASVSIALTTHAYSGSGQVGGADARRTQNLWQQSR